jgi:hypothetical protein
VQVSADFGVAPILVFGVVPNCSMSLGGGSFGAVDAVVAAGSLWEGGELIVAIWGWLWVGISPCD